MPKLNIEEIKAIIPHRYPFLLIDEIQDYEAGEFAVAKKCVTINEPFFQGHFPSYPVMPGVLIVEALAQTGGTLVVIMGVKNSRSIANALLAGGRSADTPAAVIQEGTTSEERTFRCTLSTLADVIEHVIGEVADL